MAPGARARRGFCGQCTGFTHGTIGQYAGFRAALGAGCRTYPGGAGRHHTAARAAAEWRDRPGTGTVGSVAGLQSAAADSLAEPGPGFRHWDCGHAVRWL